MDKKSSRLRRARRVRAKLREMRKVRLSVYRTPRHIYAQVISSAGDKVLASASTVEVSVRKEIDGKTGNVSAASKIGTLIAERAKAQGIETVGFDRSGFKYHGRVKALAEAAREAGLNF